MLRCGCAWLLLVLSDSDKARVLAAARAASQKEFVKSTPTWPADLPMRTDENGVQWADFRPEKSVNNNNRAERAALGAKSPLARAPTVVRSILNHF